MTSKLRIQIERVDNGYVITKTYDGTSFNDYNTTTLIKQEINDAVVDVKQELDKIMILFSNLDERNSL